MRKVTYASALIAVSMAVLVACGGSSSSSTTATTPTTPTLVNPVTVVPAMGGFSAGANVAFLQPNGTVIGSGTTDATGTAVVPLGTYSGPFISAVTGGPNVTVYNERTQGYEPFGASNSLLAIVPSTSGFTSGTGRLGVTPFTNAAAAVLIPNPASPTIPGAAASIQAAISVANATVAVSLGLPANANLLGAPAPLTSPTSKITTTDSNAALLSAMLTSIELSSKGSLLDTSTGLATDAASNRGALPASAALITTASSQLSSVISQNVAAASLTSISTSLNTLVSNVKPDPTLSNPASLAAINTAAIASNGGAALPVGITIPTPPASTTTTTTTTTTTSSSSGTAAPSAPAAPPVPLVPVTTPTCTGSTANLTATAYLTQNNSTAAPSANPANSTYGSAATAPSGWTLTAPTTFAAGQTTFVATGTTTQSCVTTTGVGVVTPSTTTTWVLTKTAAGSNAIYVPACPTNAQLATVSGTVVATLNNGQTFGLTGDVINGVLYGFFPQSGASGSGLFTGSVTGSSGGSSGLALTGATNSSFGTVTGGLQASGISGISSIALSGSGSNINYNVTISNNQLVLQCLASAGVTQ